MKKGIIRNVNFRDDVNCIMEQETRKLAQAKIYPTGPW